MKSSTLFVFILVCIFLLYLLVLPTTTSSYLGTSPDENSYIFFSKHLLSTSSLGYTEPLNENYHANIFLPRGSVYSEETKLVAPGGFLGIIVVNAVVWSVIGESYFLNSLIAVLGLIFFYYLVREVFDRKVAILSLAGSAVLPVYWYWSSRMYTDVPSAALLLGSMLYLARYYKTRKLTYVAVSAILFSISFWLRYTAIVYMVPFLLVYAVFPSKHFGIRRNILPLVVFALVFLILVTPILGANNNLYGSPITTGQMLLPQSHWEAAGVISQSISNFVKYFLSLSLPFTVSYTVLGTLGIVLAWKGVHYYRRFSIFFIASLVFTLIFFSSGMFWGAASGSMELHHSFVRYSIVIYVLLVPYAMSYLSRLRMNGVKQAIVGALLVLSIVTTLVAPMNPVEFRGSMDNRIQVRDSLLRAIPRNAVVFTAYWDKYLFPARKTAIHYYIKPNAERIQKTIELIMEMLHDGHDIYFLREDLGAEQMELLGHSYFENYQEALNKVGINTYEVSRNVYRLILEGQ